MRTKRLIKYIGISFLLWLIIHLTLTVIDGLVDKKANADIAVILGNKVNVDGTLSTRLIKRLECGLNLYKSHRVKRLIVSGGFGTEGFYEGDKMRDFLIKNGIPDSVIIVDNKGDNTLQTVKNTLQLKDKLHFKSLIVVSQYYHLTRVKMLFKKSGFNNVSSVSPDYFELRDIYSLLREFFAYYQGLIFYNAC
jgi:vancomycin permeability regulator SanA